MLKADITGDRRRRQDGFLLIEVLIASLILTASIAATMYLFRIGFQSLQRVKDSNIVSSKVPESINYLRAFAINNVHGTASLGDGVELSWDTELERQGSPSILINTQTQYNIFLYKIEFKLTHDTLSRDYRIVLFKYMPKTGVSDEIP
ncbi:MAG: prepilin-type N-terminal cleavage/methylation domain-containing protein [Nitrospirae bacterium]|nr:prepilin-type N-terminal cleavage/methylation domain-containing protein [Nitrospirota bacterium]